MCIHLLLLLHRHWLIRVPHVARVSWMRRRSRVSKRADLDLEDHDDEVDGVLFCQSESDRQLPRLSILCRKCQGVVSI